MISADLHMHTTASDGKHPAETLFKMAKEKGLDIISITDHDTVGDVKAYLKLRDKYQLNFYPGIELSTLYNGESVHVLGYFHPDKVPFKTMKIYTDELIKRRQDRMKKFIQNLKTEFQIDVNYNAVFKRSGGMIARPHLAREIIEHYPDFTHDALFEGPLSDQSKAYVVSAKLSTLEGIEFLKEAGAVVVLAHPGLMSDDIHNEVLELPFDGIETYYPRHDALFRTVYQAHAKDKGWFLTAGSDYHGIENDSKHGMIGDERLSGPELIAFLRKVNQT
jgi:3',5'-nucleoside bisphosphate phosphatase